MVHLSTATVHLHQSNTNNPRYFLKMTKTRAVTILLMIVSACGVILSLTDAYPTTNEPGAENLTETNPDRKNNTPVLVITHLVKTVEFEVGVMEDDGVDGVDGIDGADGVDTNNGTSLATTQYIETDLKLLDEDLLKEVLDKVNEGNLSSTTEESQEEREKVEEELPSPPSAEAEILQN